MPKTIQSIERAGKVLSLFSNSKSMWGVTDIARETGLTKGTAHNIARTLESINFLQQDKETRKYCLGPRILAIGTVMATNLDINQKGSDLAQKLAAQVGLACRVGIWDDDAVLVTFSATPFIAQTITFQVGPRVVAYSTGLGKALLAYFKPHELESYLKKITFYSFTPKTITDPELLYKELEDTRNRGFSINNEEMALGGASLGAPIFDRSGQLVGSMSVTGDLDRVMGTEMNSIVNALRNTAGQISRNMGYRPENP